MKPVLLEMEAFGPYSAVQIIDFTLLKDANMFLIHGSTGGGKTTILDAICYGLYGETSGKERDPDSMRSHFAKEDQLTQVKFTFKVGQNTYFVHRIPGQKRPKKVGDGFTDQKPDGWLYKLGDEEPELLAAGVTDVKDKIIEIIGFDSDQFRQVIIIPQGQFRKLLVAKSEERQKILGEIFQTRKYKLVEERIRDEERTLKNEVASLKERRKEQVKNIKYRPNTPLEALMEKENIDTNQVITEVEVLSETQEEEIKKITEEITTSEENMKLMATQITIATNNNAKHTEKLNVKVTYDDLISQEEGFIKKEKDYNLGQKALPLQTKEQYLNELALQKEQLKIDVLNIREEIKALDITYKEVTIQMEQCKEQEPETKKREINLNKAVEEYRPKSTNLIILEKDKEVIKKEIDQALERQKTLKEQKEAMDKEILEAEKTLGQRQIFNDLLRKQELESQKLSATLVQKRQLEQMELGYESLRNKYKEISIKLKKAGDEYAKASETHNQILQQWIRGQAGELARNLKESEACPVCGSTTHPKPAVSTTETATEKDLEEKKSILDNSLEYYQDIKNKQVKITTEGTGSGKQVNAQKEMLGEHAETPLQDMENAYNKLELEKKQTTETLLTLEKLNQKTAQQKEEKVKIEEEATILQEKDKENADRFTSLNTQIEHIKKEIPEELRSKEALNRYISKLEAAIKTQKEIHEKTQKRLEAVKASKIKLETSEKEKDSQLKVMEVRHEKEINDFKSHREKAGFETFEAYQKAYKSQDELERIEGEIKAYRSLYSAIEAQYKKLIEETKDIVLVDVKALEDQYSLLERAKDELGRVRQTITLEKQHNEKQMAIILKSTKQIMEKEKRYSIVGSLYDAVRGKNIKGLSFERFIQSSLFEDVLIRANERLTLMSNNRYELYRSDNRESLASQSGLDMEVLDTYTGKKRHVRTLSGGEGFMASLSLALGLADVVQSYAGGISLDTIFIDEGFGTLDTESLDAAIKTLIDLQQSGRLVGIISHVPELKERIGARLEVVSTQSGSRAKFHV
ncbi:MAG TPA: SMC family ATPase [Epulopiscium sp.]|nr:SMC family ATPase [Candidatus Epulonipiscium sp.]